MNLVNAGGDRFQETAVTGGTKQGATSPPPQLLPHDRTVGAFLGNVGEHIHHNPVAEQRQEGDRWERFRRDIRWKAWSINTVR